MHQQAILSDFFPDICHFLKGKIEFAIQHSNDNYGQWTTGDIGLVRTGQ